MSGCSRYRTERWKQECLSASLPVCFLDEEGMIKIPIDYQYDNNRKNFDKKNDSGSSSYSFFDYLCIPKINTAKTKHKQNNETR